MHPLSLRSESGYSLIELVVIVLIIGSLAAIALPAFAGQRGKANDADAKAALRHAQTAMQVHFTSHETYAVSAEMLRSEELGLASGAASTLESSGDAATYVLAVTSVSGTKFSVRRDASGVERLCDVPGHGGCPDDGRW